MFRVIECMDICFNYIALKDVIDSRIINSEFIGVKFVSVGVVVVQLKLSEQDLSSRRYRHFVSPSEHVSTTGV